jgi:hypothetical protein
VWKEVHQQVTQGHSHGTFAPLKFPSIQLLKNNNNNNNSVNVTRLQDLRNNNKRRKRKRIKKKKHRRKDKRIRRVYVLCSHLYILRGTQPPILKSHNVDLFFFWCLLVRSGSTLETATLPIPFSPSIARLPFHFSILSFCWGCKKKDLETERSLNLPFLFAYIYIHTHSPARQPKRQGHSSSFFCFTDFVFFFFAFCRRLQTVSFFCFFRWDFPYLGTSFFFIGIAFLSSILALLVISPYSPKYLAPLPYPFLPRHKPSYRRKVYSIHV